MLNEYQNKFKKNIEKISARGISQRDIFADNVSCMAIAMANGVDSSNFDRREAEYMRIIGKYSKEEIELFTANMAILVEGLEFEVKDFLGEVYESLEASNKHVGQFFTPFHLSDMIAKMQINIPKIIEEVSSGRIISICEPACGAGSLLIAVVNAINESCPEEYKSQLQKNIIFVATDIDSLCVKMAYLQMSLLGYCGVFNNGNTLSLEVWETWITPVAYISNIIRRFGRQNDEDGQEKIKKILLEMMNDKQIFLKMGA